MFDESTPRMVINASKWAVSIAPLMIWVAWWAQSAGVDRLTHAEHLWLPELPKLAADYVVHIDWAARLWASGGDPYSPANREHMFPYSPMVPRLFGWASGYEPEVAARVWLGVVAALIGAGAWMSWRSRHELGLRPIPLPALIVAVAFSTPVLFAMERGQCDVLALPAIAAGVFAMRRRSATGDLLAGLAFVLAASLKYYPGLVLVGLIAHRRWRSVGSFVAAGAVIVLHDRRWIIASMHNARLVYDYFDAGNKAIIHPVEHSLSACWGPFWRTVGADGLAEVPGLIAAAAIIVPMVALVSWRVASRDRSGATTWPLMLWIVSAATFVPPLANDYSLIFLPLAALAAWDRRDPVWIHVLMGYLLLWWQPFAFPIDGGIVLLFKVLGVAAVGGSLVARAKEPVPESADSRRFPETDPAILEPGRRRADAGHPSRPIDSPPVPRAEAAGPPLRNPSAATTERELL